MTRHNETSPLLTSREAAQLLHVHTNTIRRWSDRGLIKAHRITHRGDRRFKMEDISRFLVEMNASRGNPQKVGSIQR